MPTSACLDNYMLLAMCYAVLRLILAQQMLELCKLVRPLNLKLRLQRQDTALQLGVLLLHPANSLAYPLHSVGDIDCP